MKVKRYIVEDLPEAVQQIRAELGSDAVILNTKEIRVGGFLGMFRKKRMEVIAAIDEAAKKTPARAAIPARPQPPKPHLSQADEPAATAIMTSGAVREKYSQSPFSDSGRQPATGFASALAKETAREETAAAATASEVEDKEGIPERRIQSDALAAEVSPERDRLDKFRASIAERLIADAKPSPDKPAESSPVKPAAAPTLDEEASDVLRELRSLKEMMSKMTKQQTYRSMPDSVLNWSKRLAEQGVEPAYVEQFAEAVSARISAEDADESTVYRAAKQELLSWLEPAKGGGISASTRMVHFVGPTGVGKTTTIAKLAADQSFGQRRNVGFITADTYRIAAVDQLRTYADILNIPLEVVFSPSELTRAYYRMSDRDLLFMDTAGRNYRNELYVSEVNSLLAPGENSETILVLSMTSKFGDMKAVASQFAKYGVSQLLLTKFDETDSFGSVVNLVKEFGFRISYITNGQTVPDDIKPYDPELLAAKLLGDPEDA